MNSNPEVNALKHRIRELEDTIRYYKVQNARVVDRLRRIASAIEDTDEV